MKIKKLLAALLCVILIFGILPFSTIAASTETTYTEGYYTYTVSNGEATITDFDETIRGDVTTPLKLGGYPVTGIGDGAFSGCLGIKSIIISEGIVSIGESAFNCCVFTSISLPKSVINIGNNAFVNCNDLISIIISENVTSIGYDAFACCGSLINISVAGENSIYCSVDGILFNKEKTILIRYPSGKIDNHYTIPNSVVCIGRDAFSHCDSLKTITIPNGVKSIEWYAFYGCSSLNSIILPESLVSIEGCAFSYCDSLKSIIIPNNVEKIGWRAFISCSSLTRITISDSVNWIGNQVFSSCRNLTIISVGENNQYYCCDEFGAMFNKDKSHLIQYPANNAASVYIIPNSVLSIGDSAFCLSEQVESIIISEGVNKIGDSSFSSCYSLSSVILPNSITEIGERAFFGCELLKKIELPENLTVIEPYTFAYSGLKAIYIPAGVTSIDTDAFYNTDINYVYYGGDEEDRNRLNISTGNDAIENAVWLYNQTGLPEHEYDSDCDNVCNFCEEIRIAPNHIDSYVCDNADCEYTRIVTKEDLQDMIDTIPDTLHLDVPEKDFENSQESIYKQIENSLKELGLKCRYNNGYLYLNVITKEGYDIRLSVDIPTSGWLYSIFQSAISIKSVNEAVDFHSDKYYIDESITLAYRDTDEETLNYIKNLQLVSPSFYAIDIDKLIVGYSLFTAAEEYYFEQIGDNSLVINAYAHAGGTGGVNQSTHGGVWVELYKNNIFYYVKTVNDEYTVPIITIPYEMPNEKAYDYVVDKLTQLYKEFGENIIGIEKIETIYGKAVSDGYVVYSNIEYDDEGYVIIRKSTKCTNCSYDNVWDDTCNVCGTMREITYTGWWQENNNWAYYENGVKVVNDWQKDGSGWCYLGADGYIIKNDWLKDDGKWYHFDANGYMETEKWIKDSVGWVYLGKSGAMLTNSWCTDSHGWCYVGSDGYAVTNCWKKDSIGWIWLNENGSMTKNDWIKDDGKWYYLDSNGYMVTNEWKKDSIGWVYLGSNGAMLTNSWCTDSQGWCYVGADGYAVTNCWKKDSIGWIWLNENGSMTKSDWVKDGNYWYYLDTNGYMVYNTTLTIDGKKYTFNSSGVWIS